MKERHDPSTKPYYRCLSCPRFRKTCGGRPTRGLDMHEWCEYMRDVKEHFHLTNADIAKESDVSIKTIERIMALNYDQDIMRSTTRRIELAIIGPVGDHTCYLDYDNSHATEQINSLRSENQSLRKEKERLEKIIDKFIDGN